eukprot:jgi/Mesen1/4460/ME000227S03483
MATQGWTFRYVPDAATLESYLELFELPQLTGVVFVASVVKQVLRTCSRRTEQRIRALYADRRRQNAYLDDEHNLYTWLLLQDRLQGARQLGPGEAVVSKSRAESSTG